MRRLFVVPLAWPDRGGAGGYNELYASVTAVTFAISRRASLPGWSRSSRLLEESMATQLSLQDKSEEGKTEMMRERNKKVDEWGTQSASWRFAALTGAGLVALGAYGLMRPKAAAESFGMSVRDPEDIPSWRPKAARDLTTGVILLVLLTLGEKRALGAYMIAGALIPALDALLVALSGSRKPWQVAMHGGTAGLVLALGVALLRRGA